MECKYIESPGGFDWDGGNAEKIQKKHRVSVSECEEVFWNKPLDMARDESHSQTEDRFGALGRTNEGRLLALFFTIRGSKIRVISARDMSKKERKVYEEIKADTEV